MKIIITGGAGFVGSSLALYLKINHPDYSIVSFDNLRRRGSELNLKRLNDYDIQFIHGDVRVLEDIEELGDADLIIDASADPSVLSGINSPITPVINSNLIGTLNLLEYSVKIKAKFIFLSTSRIYPVNPLESADFVELETRFEWTNNQIIPGIGKLGVNENFPINGSRSFYGASKLASELMITEYIEHKKLEAIINRCGVISGPWQMGKIDQGVAVLWLARHFYKRELSYIGYGGTGKQTRDVIHIDDIVELIDFQIHNFALFNNQTMNVGGGLDISFSLQELTKICEEITGNKIIIHHQKENRPADLRIYIGDNSKINNLCGWQPKKTVFQLMTDTFDWLAKNENQLKNILN